jgi:hypothetical protein
VASGSSDRTPAEPNPNRQRKTAQGNAATNISIRTTRRQTTSLDRQAGLKVQQVARARTQKLKRTGVALVQSARSNGGGELALQASRANVAEYESGKTNTTTACSAQRTTQSSRRQ